LLPHLHQHALDVTGGSCSLLFQQNPRNGALQATSGFGLDALPEAWQPGPEEASCVAEAFERRKPTIVADAPRQTPDLASRLNARTALLLPLLRGTERVGLLAIGFAVAPPALDIANDAAEAGDAFMAALELIRLRQAEEMQRDVRELLDEFSASLSATLNLTGGLDIFCHGANRLFAADRTSVWIHDRRAHHLVLRASSDNEDVVRGVQISTDDSSSPAAAAMRRSRSEILSPAEGEATAMVTVPLRGCRRALGTSCSRACASSGGARVARSRTSSAASCPAPWNARLLDDVLRRARAQSSVRF
jgi:hypothetical protein